MNLFETERLQIKSLEKIDKVHFAELFTDPKVLELIPQKAFTEQQITDRFNNNLHIEQSDIKTQKCAFGIFKKDHPELIGLALFLKNEDNEEELGYRFRANAWGNGYGTETTKGMLEFYFNTLHTEKVTADVNIANIASVKILEKFMKCVKEFFNERDNCTDRRYELEKNNWLQQNQ